MDGRLPTLWLVSVAMCPRVSGVESGRVSIESWSAKSVGGGAAALRRTAVYIS